MRFFIFFFFLLLLLPFSLAHLDGGVDIETDLYTIDFGYSPEQPLLGSPVSLSFSLLDKGSQEFVNLNTVWVRIADADTVYFAGNIEPTAGNAALNYVFPQTGEYTLTVRFIKNKVLAEHDFTLNVEGLAGSTGSDLFLPSLTFIGGLIIGFLARKKR
ncbi:hypothetical protein COV20_05075 [Candidatus Woesearchaeota archaeon CG10_big_fil_rev_8_21_14_0_10_45_16]|nr:MAG: hypothetical protein COV20_05075 [Candidatus Woesearchaeota archaeon CG10_big_fil_rev_8_21_14_0_10_45_16]